jgi:hypothetical protein
VGPITTMLVAFRHSLSDSILGRHRNALIPLALRRGTNRDGPCSSYRRLIGASSRDQQFLSARMPAAGWHARCSGRWRGGCLLLRSAGSHITGLVQRLKRLRHYRHSLISPLSNCLSGGVCPNRRRDRSHRYPSCLFVAERSLRRTVTPFPAAALLMDRRGNLRRHLYVSGKKAEEYCELSATVHEISRS